MSIEQNGAAVGVALGRLFGWDGGRDRAVYEDQLDHNASLAQKLAVADRERLRTMARRDIAANADLDPLTRALILGESGSDYSAAQQGRLREQEVGLRGEAFGRADAAGYGVNAPLIALANGPVEFNKALAGGNLQGDTYRPGAELAVTELGLGELFKDRSAGQASLARAGASAAQANASNARAALYGEQATNPERFRAPPRAGATNTSVYTVKDATEAIEYNRMANRPNSGLTPIPVPVPGTPKGAAAPTSTVEAPSTMPIRATNPATGEVLELRNGQWVKVQ